MASSTIRHWEGHWKAKVMETVLSPLVFKKLTFRLASQTSKPVNVYRTQFCVL